MVVFGGHDFVTGVLNDTWEHDGTTWIRRTPLTSPPVATTSTMAYDPVRGEIWLSTGYQLGSDMWRWNGQTWTQGPSLPPPSTTIPSYDGLVWHGGTNHGLLSLQLGSLTTLPAMWRFDGTAWVSMGPFQPGAGPASMDRVAYAPATGLTYVDSGGMWAWNGTQWLSVTQTGAAPAGGPGLPLAWDAARARLVSYAANVTHFGELVGPLQVHWTSLPNIDPVTGLAYPSPRIEATLVHDSMRQRTLLFGGKSPLGISVPFGDLFLLATSTTATTWQLRTPVTTAPLPRVYTDMAFDAPSGRMVMCAGQGAFGLQNDTWSFDGTTWTDHGPSGNVTPRMQPAIAHAPNLGTVLFGGGTGTGTYFGDTWFWAGLDWLPSFLIGAPPARMGHDMVFDSVRNEIFLHGGYDGTTRDDTWVLRSSPTFGAQWVQVATTGSPIPRQSHAMAFDARRSRVVIFGGADQNGQFLGDTWEMVPSIFGIYQFVQRFPAQSPPRRWLHKMDYDPARGVVVLTGGYGNPQCGQFCASYLNDVWEYDGDTWRQRTPSTALPAGREGAAFAYDSQRQRFVMQGGRSSVFQQETWYYTAPNDQFGEGMLGGSTMKLRCTRFPVAGQSTAFAFDTSLGFGWLTVFVGPAPQPGLTLGPGLLCGTGTFYGVGALVVDAMGFPGTTSFALPPATVGLGFVAQGISLENGFCLRLTDPLAVTVHAP